MLSKGYRPAIKTDRLGRISLFNWQNSTHFSGIPTVAGKPPLAANSGKRKQKHPRKLENALHLGDKKKILQINKTQVASGSVPQIQKQIEKCCTLTNLGLFCFI